MNTVERSNYESSTPGVPVERTRVLVIGIDAVTLDLLSPWVKAGKLPNIAKLMSKAPTANLPRRYSLSQRLPGQVL